MIKQADMTNQRVGILLIRLSFPATAGMMVYSVFSLVDTFFIARLGSASLAAFTLVIPIQILLVSISSATGVGLTSLIGRTLGQNNVITADNIAWHGIFITLIYGGIFSLGGASNIDALLLLFGCTPETFLLSKEYLNIFFIGCTFIFIPMTLGNIIQGEGDTFIPMLAAVVGIVFNVLLDPLFIFGRGIIPAMGLNGAAVATILGQVVSTIMLIVIIRRRRVFITWSPASFSPSLKLLVEIYRVGLPTMVMEIAGVVVLAIINRILTGYSYTSVAALGIFLRIRSLAYMPVFGLCQGAMPIAAFAYGAGNLERVKETLVKASALAFLFIGVGWGVLQYFPEGVMGFFSNDPALIMIGEQCLGLATLFLPFMGPVSILHTVLQALGKGIVAMWLSLARQVGFFLPLLLLLSKYLQLNGIWLAFSLADLFEAVLAVYFFIILWRNLQVRNKLALVMLLRRGYVLSRIRAWLQWKIT
ncbi:MATE family efflux transporter [Syntrophomonas erecta]